MCREKLIVLFFLGYISDNLALPGVNPSTDAYNIALGKHTEQGPKDYCDPAPTKCHLSNLAVNGYLTGDVAAGYCSHTTKDDRDDRLKAWWKVDFQGEYYLSYIRIHRRRDWNTGCCRGRLKGFTVYGLVQGRRELIHTDGRQNWNTISYKTVIVVQVPQRLHAVKFAGISISIPDYYLTLCEVEVLTEKYCLVPPLPNGNVTLQNGTRAPAVVPEETLLHYRCNSGYSLNSQYGHVTCRRGVVPPTCVITCGNPNRSLLVPNGIWLPYAVSCYQYNCQFRLQCSEGYIQTVTHDITATCGQNSQWRKNSGDCKAIVCPHNTSDSMNYSITNPSPRYTYGDQLSFECNEGFKLISGNLSRSCLANGKWSGEEPSCSIISCTVPKSNDSFNQRSPNPAVFKSVLESRCNDGYKYKSGTLKRTCQANGQWSGTDLICEEMTCQQPKSIAHGKYYANKTNSIMEIQTFSASFKVNTTLIVKCSNGYELARGNNSTKYCLNNGTWSGLEPTCIAIQPKDPEASTASDNAAVIGGSVGTVVSVIMIILVIVGFMVIRRRSLKSNSYTDTRQTAGRSNVDDQRVYSNIAVSYQNTLPLQTPDTSEYSCIGESQRSAEENKNVDEEDESRSETSTPRSAETEISFEENHDDYYNITSFDKKSPSAIMLEDLVEFVLTGKKTKAKLEEQFNRLPSGLIRSHKTALKPINMKKNRYKQIYAYDENRVILRSSGDRTEGDYINACYIHGYDKARAYIASQGPTKDMINDFWDMVWHQDCGKIVMLTNLKEENKMKCIQYWPNKGSQVFGSVTVMLKDTEKYSDFSIRTLAIKQSPDKAKIVRQFHFTSWPDRGVPKFASSIVNFRNKVRNTKSYCNGPTVVHCSAGIGRTGTYIALDILTEQGKSLGYVDVAACVATLRRQRVNMVQNLDQYLFLHSALTEALMLSSSAIPASHFPETYRELLQVDPVKKRRNIEITFDMLKNMSPVVDENQYISAREVRNKKRNRYSNILPVSEFMPTIKGSTKDGYINAVYLPSYKERKAMILTQMPLVNTKEDFWALIQEHNVHTIVMLNNVTETEREEIYWPDVGESQTYNDYDIESLGEESIGEHIVVNLQLSDKYTERTVKQVQCRYWPSYQSLPNSPSDIIETIDLVQKLQQQSGNHPIVVHCINGVERSGLFCVISAVIERLKIEQDVAITQVIEQMRCCRDQIIPSVEQFQFCHEVVLTFIQQFNEYSNFSSL